MKNFSKSTLYHHDNINATIQRSIRNSRFYIRINRLYANCQQALEILGPCHSTNPLDQHVGVKYLISWFANTTRRNNLESLIENAQKLQLQNETRHMNT